MAVNKRIAKQILYALEGGMVPENGLPYIAVGRKDEIAVITHDMDRIAEGYSAFRLIEGAYGTGKSFMAQLIKNEALLRGFLVMDCELAPERKLCGTKKEGLETYRVLLSKMASKASPNGHALEEVLDSYIYGCLEQLVEVSKPQLYKDVMDMSLEMKQKIEAVPHGFDFWEAFDRYIYAVIFGNTEMKDALLRWFRGEYHNRTTGKKATGLSVIIDDAAWFSYIKIWAIFAKEAGYAGLYMILDELTQITRNIVNSTTREHNFERLLSMYNDCYGNDAHYMGIILCGIPSSIHDPKRGIFSYEALKSRLCKSDLQGEDLMKGSPILTLSMLTPEEFTALLEKVEEMHALLHGKEAYFTEDERITFVEYEYKRIGAATHLTPREFLRDYLTILNQKADTRAEDSMEDFLYRGGGMDMTQTMIGTTDEDEDDMIRYEGFTL